MSYLAHGYVFFDPEVEAACRAEQAVNRELRAARFRFLRARLASRIRHLIHLAK